MSRAPIPTSRSRTQAPLPEKLPLPPPPAHTQRDPIVFVEGAEHKVLEGKRIAGRKWIVPDDDTKRAIDASRVHRVTGSFRLCIDETGHVESILPFRSTGFATYDREILAGMQAWAYSPYTIDDKPVAVCTGVTFIYTQR